VNRDTPSAAVVRPEGPSDKLVPWWDRMTWAKPNHKREDVNRAGRVLVSVLNANTHEWTQSRWEEWDEALQILNNWRSCHGYPLNAIQTNLRHAARKFDPQALFAQRTKRLVSMAVKLQRFPNMKLSQMQDVGGCRAVVKSSAAVLGVDRFLRTQSRMMHELATCDDYIAEPRPSGYRGIHHVYRYHSDSPSRHSYNGLKIEMQLRSQYQHAWATAVETVGTFTKEALKSSSGPEAWLRFFTLMGSAIALRERTPLVPGTPSNRTELVQEIDHHAYILAVENRLNGYANMLQKFEQEAQRAHYYLLQLDPSASQLVITGFQKEEAEKAQQSYLEAERKAKETPGTDAVLVSVDSLAALPRAYPNYFADTRIFVQLLKQVLSGHQRRIFTGALAIPGADFKSTTRTPE
jgi:ppGpp synthetase/RelA/SpoT-type nucleotidyltranferase